MNVLLSRTLPVAGVALLADTLTKRWAQQVLALLEPTPLIGDLFRLTLSYNTGVAFSVLADAGILVTLFTGIIIIVMSGWAFRALVSGELPPQYAWPTGLVFGGALANFIDRLPDGRVTDFLDIGLGATRWPTFNVADVSIVTGVIVILLLSLRKPRAVACGISFRQY